MNNFKCPDCRCTTSVPAMNLTSGFIDLTCEYCHRKWTITLAVSERTEHPPRRRFLIQHEKPRYDCPACNGTGRRFVHGVSIFCRKCQMVASPEPVQEMTLESGEGNNKLWL